jgi:hypothetical protein
MKPEHWSETHEREMLEWLITYAKTPGCKAAAWYRVQELEKASKQTGFHVGIEKKFLEEMKGTKLSLIHI